MTDPLDTIRTNRAEVEDLITDIANRTGYLAKSTQRNLDSIHELFQAPGYALPRERYLELTKEQKEWRRIGTILERMRGR